MCTAIIDLLTTLPTDVVARVLASDIKLSEVHTLPSAAVLERRATRHRALHRRFPDLALPPADIPALGVELSAMGNHEAASAFANGRLTLTEARYVERCNVRGPALLWLIEADRPAILNRRVPSPPVSASAVASPSLDEACQEELQRLEALDPESIQALRRYGAGPDKLLDYLKLFMAGAAARCTE